MTRIRHLQIGVDIIARNEHAVSAADIPNAPKFVRAPSPPGRIVRIRENEKFRMRIRTSDLAASQLPQTLTDAVGTFHKPVGW